MNTNPTQLLCAAGLGVVVLLAGCSQTTSSCSDAQTIDVVKDIYRDGLRKVLSISPEFAPKLSEIESLTQVEVQAIRTVAKDESVGRVTCEANLAVRVPAELAKFFSTPGLAGIALHQESIRVNGNQIEKGIRYTSQLTDDKKQVRVEATGVSDVAQLIAMSSMNGMLKPEAPAPSPEEQKPAAANGPSPRMSSASESASPGGAAGQVPASTPQPSSTPVADSTATERESGPKSVDQVAEASKPRAEVANLKASPSFSCSGSLTSVERTICESPELAAADAALAKAYTAAIAGASDPESLRRQQREWRQGRDTCAAAACILSAYEKRNAELVK